ncbi:energy-coupling factor transporter transmembrane component T [Pseudogemmobacter bohemicus]|uniref:energy-coupling factor transporter transmembrane component T n=1 Tax=Pseudogemmobacter bohemicus TaxID=2250708 RepID=UPI000DD386A3|nr:energy-coupling factor transporter transmembrane component T [Pseudogemmobacter bohemicus]
MESVVQEARQIRDSLQMRGFSARNLLRERFRMLAGMVNPLVRGLITEAPIRAGALEMRGFRARPRRGLIDPVEDSPAEIWLRRGVLALAVLQPVFLLLWR